MGTNQKIKIFKLQFTDLSHQFRDFLVDHPMPKSQKEPCILPKADAVKPTSSDEAKRVQSEFFDETMVERRRTTTDIVHPDELFDAPSRRSTAKQARFHRYIEPQ